MKFRLSDLDRERLGCPEWLDVDLATLPVQEAIELEAATGLTAGEIITAIQPSIKRTKGGRNVSFTAEGTKIRVWLGLKRADVDVEYDELDFDLTAIGGVHFVADEAPGKAPSSPSSSPTTPSTSRTSGRRTRSSKSAS